jgi:hypothetical protein
MGPLATGLKLGAGILVHRRLCIQESLQIKSIVHDEAPLSIPCLHLIWSGTPGGDRPTRTAMTEF